MQYYPKNKITTNLYNDENVLVIKGTSTIYNGYYWKDNVGKLYTGKTPNDGISQELEIIDIKENEELGPISQIALLNTPDEFYTQQNQPYSEKDIINYTTIKNINTLENKFKKLPSQHFPKPTQDDYNFGKDVQYYYMG